MIHKIGFSISFHCAISIKSSLRVETASETAKTTYPARIFFYNKRKKRRGSN